MRGYIAFVILLAGCIGKSTSEKAAKPDQPLATDTANGVRYDQLKEDFFTADSVVLFSHHSPNMPIKNPKTGKYENGIPFIENDRINYTESVQERKQLSRNEIEELTGILTHPAVDDSISFMCFHPRNAVAVFKKGALSCFDFCFECSGFSTHGSFRSGLIMNTDKYRKLYTFYRKQGFKYEME